MIYTEVLRMFRSRHFYYMNVLDIKGRRIGFIKDLLIDFNRSSVIGFAVSSNSILKKKNKYINRQYNLL